jgi:hypothetical protein
MVKPESTATARQRLGNHVAAATNTRVATRTRCFIYDLCCINIQYVVKSKQVISSFQNFVFYCVEVTVIV